MNIFLTRWFGRQGKFALIALGAALAFARAAEPVVPDQRDGEVLTAALQHLLIDPDFAFTRIRTNGSEVMLHVCTPEKTGFLQAEQMRHDIGQHTLPDDLVDALQQRNKADPAKPDSFAAVTAYYTNLALGHGIITANLDGPLKQSRSFRVFEETFPEARGWAEAYLPGYAKDGASAVVRIFVGPAPHSALMTAVLEKNGGKWVVKWHHIARYM